VNRNLDLVDRLRKMVRSAGLSDAHIDGGATLSQAGTHKAAAALGVDPSEMTLLMSALRQRIRDERRQYDTMNEDMGAPMPRYAFEKDAMGNVTVRDTASGDERFVSGTQASALLNRLSGSPQEQRQKVLAAFWNGATPSQGMVEAKIVPTHQRAMTADQEDQAGEQEHWDALKDTGFYGRQGAGCVVIAQDTGRLLVMHRSRAVEEPGTWGNCGGAVGEGVDPAKHALQELYEETGYQGEVKALIPLYKFQKGTFRYFNFLAVVPHEFEVHRNWESQGSRWCTIGDWPTPLHFGLVALFNDADSMDKIRRVAGEGHEHHEVHEAAEHEDPETAEIDDDLIEEAALDEEPDFSDEIRRGSGTFNFPWNAGGAHGSGTAKFGASKTDGAMVVKVLLIFDAQGQQIKPSPAVEREIHRQAVAFSADA
jgi:8-oxo-dGTP pyrophosphatase MutT (NUDIX family)